ncbi:AB hydrolase superfamily protein YfhM [Polaromonas sp.]|nr:AB hydrolase superfamily protein YfhM [Polaromonas sp.]
MIETSVFTLPHGIELSCRSSGVKGRPVLMFLHGFPEAAFIWDDLLKHFSQPENGGFHCIAPNLRGYEQSSAPPDVAAYRAKYLMQDIAALIALVCGDSEPHAAGERGGQLACLIAHDWGGAVAWSLAAAQPELMKKLVIINSPHPGTFLRELQHSPAQQAASAYMNFLIRPDAEALLVEDHERRLWEFFTNMGALDGPHAWLNDSIKAHYRKIWRAGLTGPLNYYRASPLRPPRPGPPHHDPAAAAVVIARDKLQVNVPTLVIWGMNDIALPPALLDGLEDFVPQLQVQRVEKASHWIVHERPALVIKHLQQFIG